MEVDKFACSVCTNAPKAFRSLCLVQSLSKIMIDTFFMCYLEGGNSSGKVENGVRIHFQRIKLDATRTFHSNKLKRQTLCCIFTPLAYAPSFNILHVPFLTKIKLGSTSKVSDSRMCKSQSSQCTFCSRLNSWNIYTDIRMFYLSLKSQF